MKNLFITLLAIIGIMYTYNVLADETPDNGCDKSDRTSCYVLVVGGDEPYVTEPGINKMEIID